MDFDFGTSARERRRVRQEPMGFGAPRASRAFLGALLGIGGGLGLLGGLLGGAGGKSRANRFEDLFKAQQEYSRGRGTQQEGALYRDRQAGNQAMFDMRSLANKQLNNTGQYLRDRVGLVDNQIQQIGQTARADILDQGKQAGAATQRNLTSRGLGSSTMLAGAQAQNQQATQRGLSSLAEGIAGVRGGALERTTGDVADFYRFRSQYGPGMIGDQAQFNRQGTLAGASFGQQNTGMDNNLLMNLINAAAGGKGVMTSTVGNSLGGLGNLLFLGGLLGGNKEG